MVCETEVVYHTYQYRKAMKAMRERKIRARVNKCLDELKSLMANTLQSESIAKLEKADVLELTVTHLKKLQSRNQLTIKPIPSDQDKFREGYCGCASLVSHSLASVPGISLTHHEKRTSNSTTTPESCRECKLKIYQDISRLLFIWRSTRYCRMILVSLEEVLCCFW